jgi:hypothetical protein
MALSLSKFRSTINKVGVAKTNTFEVIFGQHSRTPGTLGEGLTLMCQSVQLPEVDLMTIPYYPKVIGGGERRVVGINQYKIIPMEFIVDKNMKIVDYFSVWMQGIVNFYAPPVWSNYRAADTNSNYVNSYEDQLPYELGYKSDYAEDITINVYPQGLNDSDPEPKVYKLYNAFPVNIGNVTLSYADENKFMILPVGFTYDAIDVPGLIKNGRRSY